MPRFSPSARASRELLARLLSAGALALDDREALQLAAGLTPAQAEALFDEFGSLPEVLGASRAELARRVPDAAAARLGLAKDLARRLLAVPLRQRPLLSGWDAVADYLRAMLSGLGREQLRVLFLDRRNRLLRDEVMQEGTVDHVPVYPREILRRALELNASALVIAHNHPGGLLTPSPADVDATRQVIAAGRPLRVSVHDHFLVADREVVSFRALGLL
jgi:DNA repair protein RadC